MKLSPERYQDPNYRNYVLFVLTVVYVINFIDRQILVILQESIKQDMGLSDTQLGLLSGFAFAAFYVTAGIPIARWADRTNRRNIISASIGIWSVMTALCGAAGNYVQLLLARIGVGLGEAGASPPAHSMISDMYPPEKRATAIATYSVGVNIGILFGFLFGGLLNEYLGWRMTFVVIGLPGILIALWVRFTVAEPLRGAYDEPNINKETVPLKEAFSLLFKDKVIRNMCMGSALYALVGYAAVTWLAPFYIRIHGMGTAELSWWLAIAAGVFGGTGTFAAGYFSDRFGKLDKRWYTWVPAIGIALVLPSMIYILTSDNLRMSLASNFFFSFISMAYLAPTIAVIHSRVGSSMRAMGSAVVYLILNVVGLGIGVPMVGMISDALTGRYGVESLRYALLFVIPICAAWALIHFLLAAHHTKKEQTEKQAT